MEYKNIVLMISGRQGAGKSTLANNLCRWATTDERLWFYSLKFADPLYEMHEAIFNVLERLGEPRSKKTDGNLLQILGTEWGRKCVDPDLWVRILKGRVAHAIKETLWPRHRLIIIDDARMMNEIECFDKLSGVEVLKLRLECNEGFRKARAEKWRPNTMHPSEIGLDDYPKFDHIIYTDTNDATTTFELARRCILERIK